MRRTIFYNTLFNILAQSISFVSILFIAHFMDAAQFGDLSFILSCGVVLSIVLTLQLERVYVRIPISVIWRYFSGHICIMCLTSLIFIGLCFIASMSVWIVALAFSISLNQATNYVLARVGIFPRIWCLKSLQAGTLLLGIGVLVASDEWLLTPLILSLSWLISAILVWPTSTWNAFRQQKVGHIRRRIWASFQIIWVSMVSMTLVALIREGPIILAGLMRQTEIAATLGLVNRILGQPLGLIGKSVSAVISNIVAKKRVTRRLVLQLGALPAAGIIYAIAATVIITQTTLLSHYNFLVQFIVIMTPGFLAQLYLGVLGPVSIAYKAYKLEMKAYVIHFLVGIVATAALIFLDLPFFYLLIVLSVTGLGLSSVVIVYIYSLLEVK